MYRLFLFSFFLIIHSFFSSAQQLIPFTLLEAEEQFMSNNLSLLAEKYAIEKAEAEVLQARLFDNPVISFEQNIYNKNNRKYFDFGRESQQMVEIEQLISIAGQRNNRIRVEKVNHEMAVFQFEELIRTLRSELKEKFISLYYANKSITVYDREIHYLDQLVGIYKQQEHQGNISLLEFTRLQALLLNLQQERNDAEHEQLSLQHELALLLGLPALIKPEPIFDESVLTGINPDEVALEELMILLPERPDLKLALAEIRASEANVKLQRSLSFPEVNVKGVYDRASNICENYFGLGLSFTLPVFNRNQGNIKAARSSVQQQSSLEQQAREQAVSEMMLAYDKLENASRLFRMANQNLEHDFEKIMQGVNENYQKRNINLIEFIDFYQAYKETCLQLFDIRKNLFMAADQLNTVVGRDVITYPFSATPIQE